MTGKPTISVILLSYNHEAFISEALNSWFSQDFPDFELVIADDASTDRTREIIAAELAKPRASSVRIVERHQDQNVGVLANVNSAMAACSGDIIVTAAGDDVSEPHRLRHAAEVFEADPTVFAVVANYTKIKGKGCILIDPGLRNNPGRHCYADEEVCVYADSPVCGATSAYRAVLFREFGPMQSGAHGEDNCYVLRALLLGAVFFDPRPSVRWRQHGANLFNHSNNAFSAAESRQRYLRFLRQHELMAPQWEADISLAAERGWLSSGRAAMIAQLARNECAMHALDRCSLGAAEWAEWLKSAWPVVRMGRWNHVWRKFWLRLLPWKRARAWRRLANKRG